MKADNTSILRTTGSFILLMIGIIAICFVFYGIYKEYNRASGIDQLIAQLEGERDRVASENTAIRDGIARIDSPEERVREANRSGFHQDNVKSVVISGLSQEEEPAEEYTAIEKKSHYEVWIDSFFTQNNNSQ